MLKKKKKNPLQTEAPIHSEQNRDIPEHGRLLLRFIQRLLVKLSERGGFQMSWVWLLSVPTVAESSGILFE